MKKLITILIFISLTIVGFGQTYAGKGIRVGKFTTNGFVRVIDSITVDNKTTPTLFKVYGGATELQTSPQFADYVIDKVGSTYYARPGIGTTYTAYSGSVPSAIINSAMGQLTAGGVIYIKAGLYDNCDSITVPYDNITIRGAGKYLTKLKIKANFDVTKIHQTGFIVNRGMDHFTISDLELDGNGANQSKIDNGAGLTALISGVYARDVASSFPTVENCYIHDFTEFGVLYATVSNGLIQNCHFADNYWNNISFWSSTTWCQALDNYCEGSGDVSITTYGTDNEVGRNTIMDVNGTHGSMNSHCSIALESNTSGPVRNKIYGNKIIGATVKEGISAPNSPIDCFITDNEIYDLPAADDGIEITGGTYCTISGNKIYRVYFRGIYLVTSTYCSILNNDISQITNNHQIDLATNSLYNKIIGNILQGAKYGIYINAGCNSNVILSNVGTGNGAGRDFTDLGASNIYKNNYSTYDAKWVQETGTQSNLNTATSDGLTTGIITAGSQNLTVTSNTNDIYIISLPAASAATIGTKITGLLVGAKICELRVQAAQATTVYINGIVANPGVEAALPAACNFEVTQVDATHWILKAWTALGAEITAIVPDAV